MDEKAILKHFRTVSDLLIRLIHQAERQAAKAHAHERVLRLLCEAMDNPKFDSSDLEPEELVQQSEELSADTDTIEGARREIEELNRMFGKEGPDAKNI